MFFFFDSYFFFVFFWLLKLFFWWLKSLLFFFNCWNYFFWWLKSLLFFFNHWSYFFNSWCFFWFFFQQLKVWTMEESQVEVVCELRWTITSANFQGVETSLAVWFKPTNCSDCKCSLSPPLCIDVEIHLLSSECLYQHENLHSSCYPPLNLNPQLHHPIVFNWALLTSYPPMRSDYQSSLSIGAM